MTALDGRVAVVTGATGVLGGSVTRALAASGAAIGIVARSVDRAEGLAEELRGAGADALALPADVLDQAQLEAARDAALDR